MTTEPPNTTFDLLTRIAGDPQMFEVFSERETVDAWLRTEVALASAQAELGIIPRDVSAAISRVASVDVLDLPRLWREAQVVGYPILPLVRQLDALLPEAYRGNVHLGATTQDVMDTGLVLQLARASDELARLLEQLCDELEQKALEHVGSIMPGRTHAMHAVPTTFGAKLAVYLSEFARHHARARAARAEVATLSLYGAGGTSAAYGPHAARLRRLVAHELALRVDDVPWHVSRGRLAEWAQTWVLTIGSAARLAREIIDLSRNEISEVAERDGHHRGASSTMPQKRNPITSEALVGNSIVAGALSAAIARIMEPGHERAAGEWQAEWFLLPHIATLAASSLKGAIDIVCGMRVDTANMRANLGLDEGLIMAEAYMIGLAAPLGRERAHDVVYEAVGIARTERIPLFSALERTVPPAQLGALRALEPAAYVGEAERIVDAAVETWRAAREEVAANV